jgi:hypothetical protein
MQRIETGFLKKSEKTFFSKNRLTAFQKRVS